jgi:hypothetical protein
MSEQALHILGVKVQNMLRVEFAELKGIGGSVTISGANAAGKSSIFDSIAFTLGGEALIPKDPIRAGQDEAEVEVDLGEFKVKRRFVRNEKAKDGYTSTLTVLGKDGGKYTNGQTVLNAVLGKLTFDPAAFAEMPAKQRRKLLAEIVGVDLDRFDFEEKAAESTRLAHYGVYETAKRKKESLPPVPAAKPATVDVASLNQQLSDLLTRRSTIDMAAMTAEREVGEATRAVSGAQTIIADLQADVDALTKQLSKATIDLKEWQGSLPKLEKDAKAAGIKLAQSRENYPGDDILQMLQQQIATAAEANKASVEYDMQIAQRNEINATWKAEEAKREELTKKIEAVREARMKALQTAAFPVEGLGFEADDCTYNGIAFEQASQAEKIDVSLAIGMAANPRLKVLFVRQGSLLDPQTHARIEKRAAEHDYWIWYEVVDTTGQVGFYIEEGRLKAVDGAIIGVEPPSVTAAPPTADVMQQKAQVPPSAEEFESLSRRMEQKAQAILAANPPATPAPSAAPRKKPAGPPKRTPKAPPIGDLMQSREVDKP